MSTVAGAIDVTSEGLYLTTSKSDAAITFTINRPKAPQIKHFRRPNRSTTCAEMIVPIIPMALRPPARPFCFRELYPACLRSYQMLLSEYYIFVADNIPTTGE